MARVHVVLSCVTCLVAGALIGATTARPSVSASQRSEAAGSEFTPHVIDRDLTGGYQVVVADLNRDRKPDVVALASRMTELRWYENPSWQKHIIATGLNQPINAAADDTNGDGIPEIALAHEFSAVYAKSLGIISLLTHDGDPRQPWTIREIDRVPTSHRLRFADIDGTGRRVLVNFPLTGPKAVAPDYRDAVSLFIYRPGKWAREVITDADEGVVHGIQVAGWNGERRESLLSASFLGVHLMRFDKDRWTRSLLVKGDPAAWPKSGASDVVVGRIGQERFLATIEPWHGNTIAVYRQRDGAWNRQVIDETVTDGHTMAIGDFDGDDRDEFVVGERQGRRSVYLYRLADARQNAWSKQPLDDGDMSAAGCAVADLDGDKRQDVVCIGTATANLKWYQNRR